MINKFNKSSSLIKPVAAIALALSALVLPACQSGGERYEERESVEEREGSEERKEGIGEEREGSEERREGLNREEEDD